MSKNLEQLYIKSVCQRLIRIKITARSLTSSDGVDEPGQSRSSRKHFSLRLDLCHQSEQM